MYENTHLEHSLERIIASGSIQLLVNLETDELRWRDPGHSAYQQSQPGSVLCGAYTRPIEVDTLQQRSVTGVNFKPGGAASFFPGDLAELTNQHIALTNFQPYGSLRDRLLEARAHSAEAVFACWHSSLLACRCEREFVQLSAATRLLNSGASIVDTATALSLTVRKLRQEFAAMTGLLPKTYARVERVQRLTRQVATISNSSRDWADLACTHGFVDQAHMIHEFRKFVGSTPGGYSPRCPLDFNHAIVE